MTILKTLIFLTIINTLYVITYYCFDYYRIKNIDTYRFDKTLKASFNNKTGEYNG